MSGGGRSRALLGLAAAFLLSAGPAARAASASNPPEGLPMAPAPSRPTSLQGTCEALLRGRPGALVLTRPHQGRLLALVHPSWAERPLPPGSVFKLVTAWAAIETGSWPVGEARPCDGRLRLGAGPVRPCWKPGGHGALTLEEALAQSCNVNFYRLGRALGPAPVLARARAAGLGARPGSLPPLRAAEAALADLAVGEAPGLTLTPLQLAAFVGALATDGRVRPLGWTGGAPGALVVGEAARTRLRTGMLRAAQVGSARRAALAGVAIAAKTGTASYRDGSNRTYGWFVGYAPLARPRALVVVCLPEANGFVDAAAIGRRALERALAEPERP